MKALFTVFLMTLFQINLGQNPRILIRSNTNNQPQTKRKRNLQELDPEIRQFVENLDSQCPKFICNGTILGNQCAYRRGIMGNDTHLHSCQGSLSCDLSQTHFLMKSLKDIIKDEYFFFNINKKGLTLDLLKSRLNNWKKQINEQFYQFESQCIENELFESAYQILEQFWYIILSIKNNDLDDNISPEGTICEELIDFCDLQQPITRSTNLAQECITVEECPYEIPSNVIRKTIGIFKSFNGMTGQGPSLNQQINIYDEQEQIPKDEFGDCECGFDGKRRCSLTLGDKYYCELLNSVCAYARGDRNAVQNEKQVKENMYLGLFYHKLQDLPQCWKASFPRYEWVCRYVNCL